MGVMTPGVATATGLGVWLDGDCWQEVTSRVSAKAKAYTIEDFFMELSLDGVRTSL